MASDYEIARQETLDTQTSNAEAYDRAILTLSSAFLALSVSFIGDVLKERAPLWSCLLFFSWDLFALTIITTIFSYIYTQKTTDYKLRNLQKYFSKPENAEWQAEINDELARRGAIERRINLFAGLFFIVAIILTVAFVTINAPAGVDAMSRNNANQGADMGKRSAPSVPFPSQPAAPAPTPTTNPTPRPSSPNVPIQPPPPPPKKS